MKKRRRPGIPWKQIALALPAVAFAYLAFIFLTLPDVRPLAATNPETTAFIELRAAQSREAGRRPRRQQRWVRYERISNNLRRAVLVSEDSAFWTHDGVDLEQLKASLEKNLEAGKAIRGGSTITQQLAKNLYLSPSKNPVRKLRELFIARRLEAALTKRRILELYLNVIEWGEGIYGAEAAARAYFRKPASALTAEEAALLAGALINPRVHSPARPTKRLRQRQQIILRRMGHVEPPEESPATPEPAPRPLPEVIVDPPTPDVRPFDAQPLEESRPSTEKPNESDPQVRPPEL